MIYLDASAIITLIAGRRLAPELRGFLAAKPTAQILEDTLDTLVTYDKRMYDVAQSIGPPVAAPGASSPG